MEHNRQLRLLIPPFVLLTSILIGMAMDPALRLLDVLSAPGATAVSAMLPALLAGGVAIVAFGFLLSSLTLCVIRVYFALRRVPSQYEAEVRPTAFARMWETLRVSPELSEHPDRRYMLQVVEAYNWTLPDGLASWLARRWNMFMVSTNSCVALILAPLLGDLVVGVHDARTLLLWWLGTGFGILALAINAYFARRQMIELLEFLPWCEGEALRRAHGGDEASRPPVAAEDSDNSPNALHRTP